MKTKLSKLSRSALEVSQRHLANYLAYLNGLDSLYFYRKDCQAIAVTVGEILETIPKLTTPGFALGVVRVAISLIVTAGEYSAEAFTGGIETNLGIVKAELQEVIAEQRQATRKNLAKRAKKHAA